MQQIIDKLNIIKKNNIIIDVIMELSKNKNIINKKTIDETIYEKINL